MKTLVQTIQESLINEGKDWIIYMPIETPDEIERIYNTVNSEFDNVEVATDSYAYGDPSLKCYVYGVNANVIKKFAKAHDAGYEEN